MPCCVAPRRCPAALSLGHLLPPARLPRSAWRDGARLATRGGRGSSSRLLPASLAVRRAPCRGRVAARQRPPLLVLPRLARRAASRQRPAGCAVARSHSLRLCSPAPPRPPGARAWPLGRRSGRAGTSGQALMAVDAPFTWSLVIPVKVLAHAKSRL